jgi:uncharacterized protein YutE (UPF0331/DUF86 family)
MDKVLIEKHLVFLGEAVAALKQHGKPASLATDPVQFGFVVHSLQTAVQAAIDVAAMIVSARKLGEPTTNREMFEKLATDGWVTPSESAVWIRIVSFRNIVVHRYLQVDVRVVRSIVENHLEDLLGFARSVRDRLQRT